MLKTGEMFASALKFKGATYKIIIIIIIIIIGNVENVSKVLWVLTPPPPKKKQKPPKKTKFQNGLRTGERFFKCLKSKEASSKKMLEIGESMGIC